MGTLIQIRDVRDEVHRTLKARAAGKGVSLSEYLRVELERVAASPTPDELLARLQSRRPVRPVETSADALCATRDQQA
ncbi:MAG: FitA-like ribbon-helix-helix domain-containing protein [Solirubrobacteraceae bacterium]